MKLIFGACYRGPRGQLYGEADGKDVFQLVDPGPGRCKICFPLGECKTWCFLRTPCIFLPPKLTLSRLPPPSTRLATERVRVSALPCR